MDNLLRITDSFKVFDNLIGFEITWFTQVWINKLELGKKVEQVEREKFFGFRGKISRKRLMLYSEMDQILLNSPLGYQ